MWNLPNLLTLLRVAVIPVLICFFYLSFYFPWAAPASSILFILAAITDWFDGWLARRWNETSNFGAFMDPVADKLIVATALVLLVEADPRPWITLPAIIIIGREIAVSALREWMAELGARTHVAVSWVGKLKTVMQMVAIALLLWRFPLGPLPIYDLGVLMLFVAAILTLWSMILYLKAAWPRLMEQ
ncbi:MAG TPA: CDP-diacylglycerol--glycerol-3-phosphate 3-phosphatidyltransferase [Gammaproteobacteria bacterium]|nr:CDP-diacylglycerol--glycerol-3-phosphate 3-phosphatidyltransferase [Gammaproteobacteria bacterium]